MDKLEKIQVIHNNDISISQFCTTFVEQLQPVVIKGGINDWPAIKQWTNSYLIENAGDYLLRVKPKTDYVNGQSMRDKEDTGVFPLTKILELITADKSQELSYARESDLLSHCPTLASDIITPPYIGATTPHLPPRTGSINPKIWIGPSNTIAQLHWDPEHNLFAQVRGRKQVILVHPKDSSSTYPVEFSTKDLGEASFFTKEQQLLNKLSRCADEASNLDKSVQTSNFRKIAKNNLTQREISTLCDFLLETNNCHVDAGNPSFLLHSRFSEVKRYEAILDAGDLIFIPYFWYHYIRSLEPSISVNWFFLQSRLADTISSDWVLDILLGHLNL